MICRGLQGQETGCGEGRVVRFSRTSAAPRLSSHVIGFSSSSGASSGAFFGAMDVEAVRTKGYQWLDDPNMRECELIEGVFDAWSARGRRFAHLREP